MIGIVGVACVVVFSTRTPILTYHDVIEARDSKSVWFDCTIAEFESQIKWLNSKGATFISLRTLENGLTGKQTLPKNAVCLTFADNYLGFYLRAWPILRKYRIPAAQFVHTGFVGSKSGRPKMSWAQIRELDKLGLVTFGSQTVSHPADLTKLSESAISKEFRDSKSALEAALGHPIRYLAYPNGKYDARSSTLATKAGYALAFTEACRPAELAPNLYQVPRYVHTKLRQGWKDSIEQRLAR